MNGQAEQATDGALAEFVASTPMDVVLQETFRHLMENTDCDTLSASYGLSIGIYLAIHHPEWAQAVFLRLSDTKEKRDRHARMAEGFTKLVPMHSVG